MSRLARWLLAAIGVVAALFALTVLSANMYLQSNLSREKIERAFSDALRMPVSLDRVSYTPWGGIDIQGIRSKQPGEREGNFLEAQQLTAKLAVLPLFRREFSIQEIRVENPAVHWWQNEKGRWKLPKREQEEPSTDTAATTEPESEENTAEKVDDVPSAPVPEEKSKGRDVSVRIAKAQIKGGAFHFLGKRGENIFVFEDVNASSAEPASKRVEGTASIGRAILRDSVFLHNLRTNFQYTDDVLTMPDFRASLAGGEIKGNMRMEPEEKDSPYSTKVSFSGVDIGKLLAEAGSALLQASGTISGEITMEGETTSSDSIKGAGRIQCDGGRIERMELLSFFGRMFSVEELMRLDLKNAHADFRMDDGRIFIDSLVLESSNLRLTGTGRVKMNGRMDIVAQLAVNDKISRRLPSFILQNFEPVAGTDQRVLEFDVKGSLDNPRSNFTERLGVKDFERQAADLVRSIIGVGKKPKPKQGDSSSESVSPAPSPAPQENQ